MKVMNKESERFELLDIQFFAKYLNNIIVCIIILCMITILLCD